MSPRDSAIATFRERVEQLARAGLDPNARFLAWVILLHADEEGRAYPGSRTLARLTGLSARTVQRLRPALKAAFDVVLGGSDPGMVRGVTHYTFRAIDPGQGDSGHSDSGQPDHGQAVSSTPDRLSADPGQAVSRRTIEEPEKNQGRVAPLRVAARVVRKRKPGGNGTTNGTPWVGLACEDWNARYGPGSAPGGRIAGGLGPVVKANGWGAIRPAWQRYLRETRHPAPSAQDFAAHWLDWKPETFEPARAEARGPIIIGPRPA